MGDSAEQTGPWRHAKGTVLFVTNTCMRPVPALVLFQNMLKTQKTKETKVCLTQRSSLGELGRAARARALVRGLHTLLALGLWGSPLSP